MGTLQNPVRQITGVGRPMYLVSDLIRGTFPNGQATAEVGYSPNDVTPTDVGLVSVEAPNALFTSQPLEEPATRNSTTKLMAPALLSAGNAPADIAMSLAIMKFRGESINTGIGTAIPIKNGCAFFIEGVAAASIAGVVGRLMPNDRVIAKFIDKRTGAALSDIVVTRSDDQVAGSVTLTRADGGNFEAAVAGVPTIFLLILYEKGDLVEDGYDSKGEGTIASGNASVAIDVPYIGDNAIVLYTLKTAHATVTAGLCEVRASRVTGQSGQITIGTLDGGNVGVDVDFEYAIFHI